MQMKDVTLINEKEDKKYKYFRMKIVSGQFIVALEKSTSKNFIIADDDFAKSCGYESIDAMMSKNEYLDFFSARAGDSGYFEIKHIPDVLNLDWELIEGM